MRLGTGFTASQLDPRRDYRIVLPEQKKIGGTVLEGGRNIVIVGGQVSADPNTTSDFERRGIYIKNAVGTVHIEGVEIDGAGLPFDGIAINAPEATVQIQNVRVTNLNGSYDGFHADVIQPWGGVRDLRIDRVTGSSNYQGLFLQPDLGPIGSATIQNVDLTHTGPASSSGAYMVWLANGCTSYPISLSEVYVGSDVAWDLNRMVYPSATAGPAECAAQVSGGSASWPRLPITGSVVQGSPAGGSFVPAGVAGTGYVSPGYGTAPSEPPTGEPEPEPEPTVRTLQPSASTLTTGNVYSGRGAVSRLFEDDSQRLEITAARVGTPYIAEIRPTASITAAERDRLAGLKIDYDGGASRSSAAVTVRVFNFARDTWEVIDGPRSGSTQDRAATWSNTGAPKDYVSSAGEMRVSVHGQRSSGFRLTTDLVRFTVTLG